MMNDGLGIFISKSHCEVLIGLSIIDVSFRESILL